MVKIEAVIQPGRLDAAKAALEELAVRDMTVSEVLDHREAGATYSYRGAEYSAPVVRIKLEILTASENADSVIAAVLRAARTRQSGDHDGRILVYEVADAINIHSGAHLQYAYN